VGGKSQIVVFNFARFIEVGVELRGGQAFALSMFFVISEHNSNQFWLLIIDSNKYR